MSGLGKHLGRAAGRAVVRAAHSQVERRLSSAATSDRALAQRLDREARAAARAHERQVALARRREARRERARRALPRQALVTAAAAAAVPLTAGVDGLLWPLAAVAGVRALSSVRALRRPAVDTAALTAAPAAAPPPPPHSVAWPAVRRLEAVRAELVRLLPLVAPAGRAAAEEAWHAAAEADAALRWQAARLAAVEPHRGADPELLRPLEDGVACSERLVAAVAELVVASADPLGAARLQDATDALHGLAHGLREVR